MESLGGYFLQCLYVCTLSWERPLISTHLKDKTDAAVRIFEWFWHHIRENALLEKYKFNVVFFKFFLLKFLHSNALLCFNTKRNENVSTTW
jgi:hypothetical protein